MASSGNIDLPAQSNDPYFISQEALSVIQGKYVEKLKFLLKSSDLPSYVLMTQNVNDALIKRLVTGSYEVIPGLDNTGTLELINDKKIKVLYVNEKRSLFIPVDQDKYKKIVSLEECFDIVWKVHKFYKHPEPSVVVSILDGQYVIPRLAIDCLNEVCSVCLAEAKPYTRCSLHFLPMTLNTDYAFSHIMIYEDLYTGYKHIRPLCVDTALTEICLCLLRIFMDFGPPRKVYIYNSIFQKPINQVIKIAKLSNVDVVVIDVECNEYKMIELYTRLSKWMKDNDCRQWSLGCYALQLELNNEVTGKNQATPFSKVFRNLNVTRETTVGELYSIEEKNEEIVVKNDSDEDTNVIKDVKDSENLDENISFSNDENGDSLAI